METEECFRFLEGGGVGVPGEVGSVNGQGGRRMEGEGGDGQLTEETVGEEGTVGGVLTAGVGLSGGDDMG